MEPSTLVLLSGFMIGLAIGAAARWAEFCTLGAIADAVILGDRRRLRAWLLAIAVAIFGTQTLHMTGVVDIGQSIYLGGSIGWLGAVLGGLMFGLGMALVGTCGFGTLIRLGGGDLRALIDLALIGLFAFMTISGPLAYIRIAAVEPTDILLPGPVSAGVPDLLAYLSGMAESLVRSILVVCLLAALLFYCFRDPRFRSGHQAMVAALIIGASVTAAWLVTGALGQDDFDPKPPVSLTFVRPLGDSLLYLMLMSGMKLTFGMASVAGVLCGAHLAARAKGQWRREGFDGDREMTRHFAGSAMMGIGGVLALGCTIGQGISAMSALALSAPLAMLSIFIGAMLGLRYLEEGSFLAAIKACTGRVV